jgi:hypothetical protein
MARTVLKHQEDDGDLSIFASGDVVLLACEHGHYWILDTKKYSSDGVKPALEQALSHDEAENLLSAI